MQLALDKLTPKDNPDAVKNWEAQARNAWQLRRDKPDAMDIYAVKQSECEGSHIGPNAGILSDCQFSTDTCNDTGRIDPSGEPASSKRAWRGCLDILRFED